VKLQAAGAVGGDTGTGFVTVHDWVVVGLFAVVPQVLASVTVLVCWPLVQVPHDPVCQLGVQATVHDWVVAGLFVIVPQLLESFTVLVCWPPVQVPHDPVCQLGLQDMGGVGAGLATSAAEAQALISLSFSGL
jgi:hypothetical protein